MNDAEIFAQHTCQYLMLVVIILYGEVVAVTFVRHLSSSYYGMSTNLTLVRYTGSKSGIHGCRT